MKQKMNLKSGMFNGLPAYACALLLLAAGLVLSVLYAVTVGSGRKFWRNCPHSRTFG